MTGLERCKQDLPEDKNLKRLRLFDSFMKLITFIVIMHGLTMVTFSYVLAFMDKMQIAESLSQTVVTEIIGPFTVYGITKTVENISKYNKWVEMFTKKNEEVDE